jgi:hypothetical protein
MEKKKEEKSQELMSIKKMDILMKLRLFVGSIFALSTLSIILVFFTDFWLPVILILFSYIMLFVLTIKLLIIRKL